MGDLKDPSSEEPKTISPPKENDSGKTQTVGGTAHESDQSLAENPELAEAIQKLKRAETNTALGYWKKGINPELPDVKLKPVTRIAGQCNPNNGLVRENNDLSITH